MRYLILHYTVESAISSLDIMTQDKPQERVSAHYIVTENEGPNIPGGSIIEVVPETKKAWHAGSSHWQGEGKLNNTSIGIELVNPGRYPDGTWAPFDRDQIRALGLLGQDIVRRYNIRPEHVLGHADIAPGRKEDPGPLLPWGLLHRDYGMGAWLDKDEQTPEAIYQRYQPQERLPQEPHIAFFQRCLYGLGYDALQSDAAAFEANLKAFQAHFSRNQRPGEVGAPLSLEDMFWAWGLVSKYGTALGHQSTATV